MGEKNVQNIKIARFVAPNIEEWDFVMVWIFLKLKIRKIYREEDAGE